ncbi:MAG: cbb3-type cytochrome oxidase assembly protein CcoS [Verrucomicrobiales bacterium]|nr:cbb3-type cytochrome oxidase assembly protein CcoS [Verrucomicrobiales bacterium]
MEVIVILIIASLLLAGSFLGVFVWATRTGQFEDTTTPAMRILTDDPPATHTSNSLPPSPKTEPS